MINFKRAYEPKQKQDGYRVLIDRLWPRGIKKADLEIDAWERELAPSTELRKSFAHQLSEWPSFRKRYKAELRSAKATELIRELAKRGAHKTVTLVYSAKDIKHNDAIVLKEVIDNEIKKSMD